MGWQEQVHGVGVEEHHVEACQGILYDELIHYHFFPIQWLRLAIDPRLASLKKEFYGFKYNIDERSESIKIEK